MNPEKFPVMAPDYMGAMLTIFLWAMLALSTWKTYRDNEHGLSKLAFLGTVLTVLPLVTLLSTSHNQLLGAMVYFAGPLTALFIMFALVFEGTHGYAKLHTALWCASIFLLTTIVAIKTAAISGIDSSFQIETMGTSILIVLFGVTMVAQFVLWSSGRSIRKPIKAKETKEAETN